MIGIKETEEAVKFTVGLANAVKSVTQDGWQLSDAFALIPALSSLPGAVKGADEIPAELEDLDPQEEQQLIADIEKMDYITADSKQLVSQAIMVFFEIFKLAEMIKNKKKKG